MRYPIQKWLLSVVILAVLTSAGYLLFKPQQPIERRSSTAPTAASRAGAASPNPIKPRPKPTAPTWSDLIHGRLIHEATREPASGATIHLLKRHDGSYQTALTQTVDETGAFHFQTEQPGTYALAAPSVPDRCGGSGFA